MTGFIYRGPLPPSSPLFYGRDTLLRKLKSACQGDIQSYAIVYGGRQNGKTTFLLHLQAELAGFARICFVDFQGFPSATTADVFDFIAKQMAAQLGDDFTSAVFTAPELASYFKRVSMLSHQNIILILEELGALPSATREDLANVIRSAFTNRFGPQNAGLNKLMVIFAGGVELYDLAASQVSTLHNICEFFYLDDLTESDSHSLLETGFSLSSVTVKDLKILTSKVFSQVHGHPYLTQKIGALMIDEISAGKKVNARTIKSITADLLQDDVLLRHIAKGLREYDLLKPCVELLEGKVKFSRFDEEMSRLELFGIAKEYNDRWIVRNPLFKQALKEWIDYQKLPTESLHLPNNFGGNMTKINIGNITIGEGATVGDIVLASTIQKSFNKAESAEIQPELKETLKQLAQAVDIMNKSLSKEKAAETAEGLSKLVEEATKTKPNKEWYSVSIEGLIKAAENLDKLGEPVINLSRKVLSLLSGGLIK